MGVLATTTSISDLLPNYLVGNTTSSDTAGGAIFSRHIDRAEGLIFSSIVNRYNPTAWTTTTYPPLLRQLAEDIACWYAIRGASTQDSRIENRNLKHYEQAFETLNLIADGTIKLAYTDGSLAATRSSGRFLTSTDYTPITALDDEQAWEVDADQIDDIEGARD